MIYCCEDCGFLFRRMGEVRTCPLCEGPRLRPTTEEETERLQELLVKKDEHKEEKGKL